MGLWAGLSQAQFGRLPSHLATLGQVKPGPVSLVKYGLLAASSGAIGGGLARCIQHGKLYVAVFCAGETLERRCKGCPCEWGLSWSSCCCRQGLGRCSR